jgi:hypothetical protein
MKKTEWKRECPKCGKEMYYKHKRGLNSAIKLNTKCQHCCQSGSVKDTSNGNWIRNCPSCNKELSYKDKRSYLKYEEKKSLCNSCTQKRDIKNGTRICWNKGKKMDDKYRESVRNGWKKSRQHRIGEHHPFFGKDGPMKGKSMPSGSLEKRIETMKKRDKFWFGHSVNFNKEACRFFDLLNEDKNINGIHALNGGERCFSGFFLDYYISDMNIAVEYDEKKHFKGGELKKEDKIRQMILERDHGIKFIRIKECETFEKFLIQFNKQYENIISNNNS